MAWLVGIYLAIGVFKAVAKLGESDSGLKPLWMMTEKNPLKFCLYFTLYAVTWPLPRK
jgi:hypothetical protein